MIRSIFFLSIFFSIFLVKVNAATLIVDDSARCMPSVGCVGACERGDEIYKYIKDALDDAQNGDTVRICPGTYDEDNLIISKGDFTLESTTNNPDDVTVENSSNKHIFKLPNYVDGVLIKGITLKQSSSKSAIYSNKYIKNIVLENLVIESNGRGVYEQKSLSNFSIKDSKITAEKESVLLKEIDGNINFTDIEFESKGSKPTIKLTNWATITVNVENYTHNVIKSQYYGMDIDEGVLTIKNTNFDTKDDAVYLRNSINDLVFSNNTIISDKRGLYAADDLNNQVYIQNNNIQVDEEALYIKNATGTLHILDNEIEGGSYGIRILDAGNKGYIQNNLIKGSDNKGLYLLSSKKWRSFEVVNNCFENGSGKNIESKDKNGIFDDGSSGNYWDDWSGNGDYEIPIIPKYDHYPLSNCHGTAPVAQLIVNYRMDECNWDGSSGDVKDSSTNGYDGTSHNATTGDDGIINRKGDFSVDSDSDYLSLPSDILNNRKNFSLSIWIQTESTKSQQEILQAVKSNGNSNPKDEFELYLKDGDTVRIKIKDESKSFDLGGSIADDNWYQLVVTKNNADVCLYLNGTLIECQEYSDGSALNISDGGIIVGQEQDSVGGDFSRSQNFIGSMDELKIFDTALGNNEVSDIYNNEHDGKNYDGSTRDTINCSVSPKIDYRMDECFWNGTSGEVEDSSGNSYDGTAKNGANTDDGKLCRAGVFDGVDDYVENGDMYQYLKTTASLSFWINTTQTGDNTDWKAPGVIGIEQSGGGDDIFWGWIDGSGHIGISKGDNDGDSSSNTVINDNTWHHIVLMRDAESGDIEIYIDGVLDKEGSTDSGDVGTSFNSIGRIENTDSSKTLYYFNGSIDELKIYDGLLTSSQVKDIYNNENSGKNYDGATRTCNNCNGGGTPIANYKFDAWDTWRSINDRNISTKIVSQTFDLIIASLNEDGSDYQEFNGTVCATVESDVEKALFSDQNTTLLSFSLAKALQDVHVGLSWIRDVDTDCPLVTEDNSTDSTDNFAIRPKTFNVDVNRSLIYAGEDFTMIYSALNAGNTNSNDYNTSSGFILDANKTLQNCGDVSLSLPTFSNGGNTTIENLDSIGDINITIKDANNSSSWAAVDSDDTNDSQRLIEQASKVITLKPYDMNITALQITKSTEDDWLYMAKALKDMNITLMPTLEVFSKNGVKLQEYNTSCYAEDVNITFYYNVNRNDDLNITFEGNVTSLDTSIDDINKTVRIPKILFVNGEANSSYSFGIDRVYDSEKNVTLVIFEDVNITTDTSAKYENGFTQENNTTFYYAQLYSQDLSTSKTTDTTTAKILVYNQHQIENYKEELLHWYIYTPHTQDDGNITQLVSAATTIKPSSDTDEITASSNYTGDAVFTVSISNPRKEESTYFIHLGTQNYLWYVPNGFGDDYNESVGSSCSQHPCIEYKYGTNTQGSGVNSGTTTGLSFEVNSSKNSRGVRLYR